MLISATVLILGHRLGIRPLLSHRPWQPNDGGASKPHAGSQYPDRGDNTGEAEDGIIMAIDHKGRPIVYAFYPLSDQKLNLMEDLEFPAPDCVDARERELPRSTVSADKGLGHSEIPDKFYRLAYAASFKGW